ncbi:MAG: dipeptide epimerase [Fimbriimonadaceae bacterium]|nr:dipeptide epimerase [Fimbriimonadaceae bacterium]
MTVAFRTIFHHKLHPLAISRGVSAGAENLYVSVSDGAHEGIGEMAPATARPEQTAGNGEAWLREFLAEHDLARHSIAETYAAMRRRAMDPATMAALDVALWDLLAKQAGMPLYRLLGLARPTVATSVTIGINPPEVIRERVPELLARTGGKHLKIKLGSPEGLEADRANFEAAREAAKPFGVGLRVDANGGWSVGDAKTMIDWLGEQGVDYVEQPLVEGEEDGLPELFASRSVPIYVDESCRFAADVPKLADRVDGVNLKLMKCGGITEALRIVAVARAHGLGTMIGCMSEGSIAIAAGAAIGALFDHIDLDSHLNLNPDPATGLDLKEGVVAPRDVPGHGARLADA